MGDIHRILRQTWDKESVIERVVIPFVVILFWAALKHIISKLGSVLIVAIKKKKNQKKIMKVDTK